jgi:hypothetical protein
MVSGFGVPGFTVRWLWAVFVVLATYNPSGHSYWHWLLTGTDTRWSLKILTGLLLLIAHLTFVFSSLRSLGKSGLTATAVLFTILVWTLLDHGYLSSLTAWSWVTMVLVLLGTVLAIGVSWSHIRGRLSGQADTNDVTLR